MTKFGDDLIASMSEALAHAKGEAVPGTVVHEVDTDPIDPRAIRKSLRLTQERMAEVMGTSLSGYRKWEQAQRTPSGAARTLLRIMAREPEAVLRALADKAA